MGWPEALVGIVGLVVVLASVVGTVYTARVSTRAEGERQRHQQAVDYTRQWAAQVAKTAANAEVVMAYFASLRDLEPVLLQAASVDALRTRLHKAEEVRIDVRTVLALTDDASVISLLNEVERRLQIASLIVAAVFNTREFAQGDPTSIAKVADVHRSQFVAIRKGTGEDPPQSLSAKELYEELRKHVTRIIQAALEGATD